MKPFTVNKEYRTNHLSRKPGGSIVTAIMKDGSVLVYENVKSPSAYIRKASEDPAVESFLVDGNPYQKTNY